MIFKPSFHSVVGPAVTFRVLPNSQNFTANDVSEKACEYPKNVTNRPNNVIKSDVCQTALFRINACCTNNASYLI